MTILLVDDELTSLRAIIGSLEAAGHTVLKVDDPDSARSIITCEPRTFQLAILDKTMRPKAPDALDDVEDFPAFQDFERLGLDLVHLLCGLAPGTPIIFLSGYLEAEDRKELGKLNNVHIVDKGVVSGESLIRLIRRIRV
jgi:CheY-like chemotaxis protein